MGVAEQVGAVVAFSAVGEADALVVVVSVVVVAVVSVVGGGEVQLGVVVAVVVVVGVVGVAVVVVDGAQMLRDAGPPEPTTLAPPDAGA